MATATASAVVLSSLLLLLQASAVRCVVPAADPGGIGPDLAWITEPSETVIAVRGKPYTLQCHSALPNVTYQWMFNNRLLNLVNDPRRQILSNGSLFFKRVLNKKSADAGSYRCLVQTPHGTISSKTITLQTAVIYEFDESPKNITVGSEASRSVIRLSCHVYSIPEATLTWQKNGVDLSSNDKRYITEVPGVLYIKNVNEDDAGSYSCVGKNHLLNKTKYSEAGHLNVRNQKSEIQPLAFISPTFYTSIKYVTEGDNVTLECAATGVPSPQLNWSFTSSTGNKQNNMLSNEETSVNILNLRRVSTKDSGTYTCHAFQSVTGWPDFPHVQTLRLEVMTPPIITVQPESQTIPIANSIRFRCEAVGNPTPNITWYHNGALLKLHGRIKIKENNLLLVSTTVSNDSGFYQCFASNQIGTTWSGALFTISPSPYEPSPPINISCRTLSSTQIQVSWRKPPTDIPDDPPILVRDDSIQLVPSHYGVPSSSSSAAASMSKATANKVFRAYTVHYMLTEGGEESQQVSVNHSIVIEKLKPYKNYTFYVRVYNGKSGSDESEKVTCKTQDGAQQTVSELVLTPLSPISLHVKWIPINIPFLNLANGVAIQYQVMWRQLHSASHYVQVVHKNVRQYTITGLKPGGQYEVHVLVLPLNGLPNINFPWRSVELLPVNPVLPVPILSYSIDKTIKLSWFVNDQSIKFDSYRLMYRTISQRNQSMMTLQLLKNTTDSHIIPFTSDMDAYEVLLNCISKNGEGETATKIISILVDILSPPSQIEAIATSFQTVNLSWVPQNSIDDLSSLRFIIAYNEISNSSENSTVVFTDPGVTSFELSGLKPYSLYEIKISVEDNNNRKSEFSQKVQIRTLQGVPGIVEQIEWNWVNSSNIHISWKEPSKSNGVIMGYYVSYTSDLHIPPTSWQQLNVSRSRHTLDLNGLKPTIQYFFMIRAATDVGFGLQSGIFTVESYTSTVDPLINSKHPAKPPALYMEDEQLLGIVIGSVIGVCCILICTTSIMLKRQCLKSGRARNTQHNSLDNNAAYRTQHARPFTVDRVQNEESVPLNDVNYITRHTDGRARYSNNMSGMALPLLEHSNVTDLDITSVHIIENPQCTVDVDGYDVDSLLSESAEGGGGTEESGCSDQLAKSQKGGDSSVVDDGFHEHVEPNKILVG